MQWIPANDCRAGQGRRQRVSNVPHVRIGAQSSAQPPLARFHRSVWICPLIIYLKILSGAKKTGCWTKSVIKVHYAFAVLKCREMLENFHIINSKLPPGTGTKTHIYRQDAEERMHSDSAVVKRNYVSQRYTIYIRTNTASLSWDKKWYSARSQKLSLSTIRRSAVIPNILSWPWNVTRDRIILLKRLPLPFFRVWFARNL